MTDLVEEVAVAIELCDNPYSSEHVATTAIEAHTRALEAAGMVVVPREPSEDLAKWMVKYAERTGFNLLPTWQAMISAALGEGDG